MAALNISKDSLQVTVVAVLPHGM